jgi:hypothetical protein
MSYFNQNYDYQQFYQQVAEYNQKQLDYSNENRNRSLVAATNPTPYAQNQNNSASYYKPPRFGPTTATSYDYSAQAYMPALMSQPGYAAPNYYQQQQRAYNNYYGYQQQQQPQQQMPVKATTTMRSASMLENGVVNNVGVGENAAVSRSCRNSRSQMSESDEIAPEIEAACEQANGTYQRRQPVIKRQVITMPAEQGPKIQQVVRRLSTPVPDIVERVFIMKPQREVVNLVIERPATPPAVYKDRTIYGKSRRPIIAPKVVRVAARHQYPSTVMPQNQDYASYMNQYNQDYNNYMAASSTNQQSNDNMHYQMAQPTQIAQRGEQPNPHSHYHHHHHYQQQKPNIVETDKAVIDYSHARDNEQQQQQQQQQQQKKRGYILGPVKYENATPEYKVDQPHYLTAYPNADGTYTYPQTTQQDTTQQQQQQPTSYAYSGQQDQQQQQQQQQQQAAAVAYANYPIPGTYQITQAPANINPYAYYYQQQQQQPQPQQ